MTQSFDENYFGRGAETYALYRPTYPDALMSALAARSRGGRAWDCATGSGQAARGLAGHFKEVIATDTSEEQISLAHGPENVTFRVAAAEASGLDASSVDLITVATALHWFDLDAFWKEVARVASSPAVLAFWCYEQPRLSDPVVQDWLDHLSSDVLGEFWDERVRATDDAYAAIDPPFDEAEDIGLYESRAVWRRSADLLGYCGTWSALERFRRARGTDPRTPELVDRLEKCWPAQGVEVVWKIRPRVFNVQES